MSKLSRPSITTRLVGPGDPDLQSGSFSNEQDSSTWSAGHHGSILSTPHTSLPFPPDVIPRPLTTREAQLVDHLVRLQLFLATAPSSWQQHGTVPSGPMYPGVGEWPSVSSGEPTSFVSSPHPALNRFLLPNGEHVTCVYWNGLYQITGTDIVRALAFRFEAFGRPVKTTMVKKFEEGVFSDLRNLKPGEDSSLEKPKSEFLDMLFKYGCIRTQKKQKVFFWFSVPHDRLFLDALERDLKREKDGHQPTTEIVGEPARSFRWDPTLSLYEQFAAPDIERQLAAAEGHVAGFEDEMAKPGDQDHMGMGMGTTDSLIPSPNTKVHIAQEPLPQLPMPSGIDRRREPFTVSLFEGSPGYKQRKRRANKDPKGRRISLRGDGMMSEGEDDASGSEPDMMAGDTYSNHGGAFQGVPGQTYGYPAAMSTYSSSDHYGTAPPASYPGAAAGYGMPESDMAMQGGSGGQTYGVPMPRSMSQSYGGTPAPAQALQPAQTQQPTFSNQVIQQTPQWSAQSLFPTAAAYGLVNSYPPQAPVEPAAVTPPQAQPQMLAQPQPRAQAQAQESPQPQPQQPPRPSSVQPASRYSSQQPASSSDNEAEGSAQSDGDESSDINSRMFRCPLDTCSRLFKRLEHLKRHVRTHTQERPYLCSKCSKRFSRSDNLTQHLKTHDKADRGDRSKADVLEAAEGQIDALGSDGYGSPAMQAGVVGSITGYAPYAGAGQQRIRRVPARQSSVTSDVEGRRASSTRSEKLLGVNDYAYGSSPSGSPYLGKAPLAGSNRYAPYSRGSVDSLDHTGIGGQANNGSPFASHAQPDPLNDTLGGGFSGQEGDLMSIDPNALAGGSAPAAFQHGLGAQQPPPALAGPSLQLGASTPTAKEVEDMQIPIQTPATVTFEGMLVTAAMTDGGGAGWPSREEDLMATGDD